MPIASFGAAFLLFSFRVTYFFSSFFSYLFLFRLRVICISFLFDACFKYEDSLALCCVFLDFESTYIIYIWNAAEFLCELNSQFANWDIPIHKKLIIFRSFFFLRTTFWYLYHFTLSFTLEIETCHKVLEICVVTIDDDFHHFLWLFKSDWISLLYHTFLFDIAFFFLFVLPDH